MCPSHEGQRRRLDSSRADGVVSPLSNERSRDGAENVRRCCGPDAIPRSGGVETLWTELTRRTNWRRPLRHNRVEVVVSPPAPPTNIGPVMG
jgi:hypothetical protein